MAGVQCSFCSMVMPITIDTCMRKYISFENRPISYDSAGKPIYSISCIELTFLKCPNCEQYTIYAEGMGDAVNDIDTTIRPTSDAKHFPEYIPKTIRDDYEEACAIVSLSPKASATLSRRCLQGMIHDFWDIKLKNLNHEITTLKDKITPDLWEAIDSLRQLGNIGAHMEKDTDVIIDIDPDEAESLIKLIELLMKEWYINREERKKLFSDILSSNSDKQELRKNGNQ